MNIRDKYKNSKISITASDILKGNQAKAKA